MVDWSGEFETIHPKLRGLLKNLRVGLIVTLVISILIAIVPLFFYLTRFKGELWFYVYYIVIPAFLVFAFMLFYIGRIIMPRVKRASRMLHTIQPQSMLMKNLGFTILGKERLELRQPGEPDENEPWGTVLAVTTKYDPLPKEVTPVTLFEDTGATDGFVVIDTGRLIVWGTLTRRTA